MKQIGPIESAAAWKGQELLNQPAWNESFTAQELAELDEAIRVTSELPIEQISESQFELPSLRERLVRIQYLLEEGSGAVLLKGIPTERYSVDELKRFFWGMMSHVGTPISQSATGEKIFSVRNEGFGEKDPKTRGPNTRKKLSYHTDRCDVIGFLCIQPAFQGGENQVVSSISVFNQICETRPDLLEVLMQPFYYKRHNVDLGNQQAFTQQPIFSIHEGHFAANFLRVLIERAYQDPALPDMTDLQREALDYVETIAADPELHFSFRQEAGDLVLLNNFVTFHRRHEFKDAPEHPRHLLRIWLSVPNSRPLHPMFAGNYGSVAAGAIRGGMQPQRNTGA